MRLGLKPGHWQLRRAKPDVVPRHGGSGGREWRATPPLPVASGAPPVLNDLTDPLCETGDGWAFALPRAVPGLPTRDPAGRVHGLVTLPPARPAAVRVRPGDSDRPRWLPAWPPLRDRARGGWVHGDLTRGDVAQGDPSHGDLSAGHGGHGGHGGHAEILAGSLLPFPLVTRVLASHDRAARQQSLTIANDEFVGPPRESDPPFQASAWERQISLVTESPPWLTPLYQPEVNVPEPPPRRAAKPSPFLATTLRGGPPQAGSGQGPDRPTAGSPGEVGHSDRAGSGGLRGAPTTAPADLGTCTPRQGTEPPRPAPGTAPRRRRTIGESRRLGLGPGRPARPSAPAPDRDAAGEARRGSEWPEPDPAATSRDDNGPVIPTDTTDTSPSGNAADSQGERRLGLGSPIPRPRPAATTGTGDASPGGTDPVNRKPRPTRGQGRPARPSDAAPGQDTASPERDTADERQPEPGGPQHGPGKLGRGGQGRTLLADSTDAIGVIATPDAHGGGRLGLGDRKSVV